MVTVNYPWLICSMCFVSNYIHILFVCIQNALDLAYYNNPLLYQKIGVM